MKKKQYYLLLMIISIFMTGTIYLSSRMPNHIQKYTPFQSPQIRKLPILGSDALGRDYMPRLQTAIVTSLKISFFSLTCTFILSLALAISVSHMPTVISQSILYLLRILFIIPSILLASSLLQSTKLRHLTMIITLILALLYPLVHMMHALLESQKKESYWLVSKSLGGSHWLFTKKHQFPYLLWHSIPIAFSRFPRLLVLESTLSFLGIGIQEPSISLGLLLQQSLPYAQSHSYLFYIPAFSFISLLFLLQWLGLYIPALMKQVTE
ncbi:ABC transporter permease subunit [Entomospira nematocerorum]|uniref:ABC transporter permease subunit n=1 Tax=Entomospira nematocerorum TaxID=2719987 RepID=A0A968GFJ8_9SPIO|nr:ABC transporter permease subunit [Entomospira nematocera]NIZ46856.1 ABC transporter permease subunit [Entomospira nematocera]WDI33345.1 ABC transporter permease subunit [Entomospira nematocera]